MFAFMLFLSKDSAESPPSSAASTLQNSLMQRVMPDFDPSAYGWKNNFEGDVCSWKSSLIHYRGNEYYMHIQCAHGLLTRFQLKNLAADIRPEFLPNSVDNMLLSASCQPREYNVRWMPRCARYVNIPWNGFYGSLNLTVLPENLQSLYLGQNAFSGPVILTKLPQKLIILDISSNHIVQSVLFYGSIPKDLKRVDIGGNRIGKVRPMCKAERRPYLICDAGRLLQ